MHKKTTAKNTFLCLCLLNTKDKRIPSVIGDNVCRCRNIQWSNLCGHSQRKTFGFKRIPSSDMQRIRSLQEFNSSLTNSNALNKPVMIVTVTVVAEFIKDNTPSIPLEKTDEWKETDVRQSQYLLQMVKCEDPDCCTPNHRQGSIFTSASSGHPSKEWISMDNR